jgi:flagellar biosynthetic protein FliR
MTISFNLGWLATVVLLSIRVAAATAMSAVLGPSQIPGSVRVLLAVSLGVLVASAPGVQVTPIGSLGQLLGAAAGELLLGAALAGGFLIAYAATQIAGRALDMQTGFAVAEVFNPATSSISPLIGTVLGMSAVCLFLAMNGHHVLIRALAASAQTFPPGRALTGVDWEAAVALGSLMFSYGLALAAPVMCTLLLADITMAVFARSLPQLNVFVMGFPLKILMALAGLAISIRFSVTVFEALFESTFRYWAHISMGA